MPLICDALPPYNRPQGFIIFIARSVRMVTALAALHLGTAVADLAIELILEANDLFLRFEDANCTVLICLIQVTSRYFEKCV